MCKLWKSPTEVQIYFPQQRIIGVSEPLVWEILKQQMDANLLVWVCFYFRQSKELVGLTFLCLNLGNFVLLFFSHSLVFFRAVSVTVNSKQSL